jgi:hypothetical protein
MADRLNPHVRQTIRRMTRMTKTPSHSRRAL